jgi:hypothetical protein
MNAFIPAPPYVDTCPHCRGVRINRHCDYCRPRIAGTMRQVRTARRRLVRWLTRPGV